MFKILSHNRSFRSLWIGQLISALGDRLTQMGILTFVMVASRNKGDEMALITFFSLLPFLLFGQIFGVLADKYSRRKIMILADVARAILVWMIPLIWLKTHSLLAIVFWFFILGSLTALFTPAKMAIITNISNKEELLEANSLIVTTGMVATLIGTFIAGLIIKLSGIKSAFYINSLTYLVSAFFILFIIYKKSAKTDEIPQKSSKTLIADIKQGMLYIWRHHLLSRLIILSCVFSFISSFAYILILNYGSQVLKQDAIGMGSLLSFAGLGMIVGSLILLKRKDKINYNRALYLSYFIIGFFLLSLIVRPPFYLTLIILFCAGIGSSILTIALDTIFQRVTPDELKGKIFATRGLLGTSVFLVSLLCVGFLIKYVSASKLFFLLGLVGLFTSFRLFFYERRWGYQLLRRFIRLLLRVLFDFKVSGIENLPKTKKVIFAGNHTSLLDGVCLMAAYPDRVYFLAAESLFKTKFWGWCAGRLGYISVKRGGFNKEAIKEAMRILNSGSSVGIFPEGKITPDGRLTEGKEGVAVIARLANADIVPFAIEGAYEAWPISQKLPKTFPISVRFAKPIDIEEYPVSQELLGEVMENIAKEKLLLEREGYLRVNPDEIVRHLINT